MENYVKEAVDSALEQNYGDVEVVVVDDGSTDGTKAVLGPYAAAGKIKYLYQANKGLAGARNTGIKNSSGAYVSFLDADDLFLPDKTFEQIKILEESPDYGVCYSDIMHFDENGSVYHHRYEYPSGEIFRDLLRRQFINPLSVMAKKNLFDRYGYFDENLRRSEDWDLWLRWARGGVKFYFLDKPLAYYRIRSVGNLSSLSSEPEMKEKNLQIFERLGGELSREEWTAYDFSSILRNLKLKTAVAYLMVGDKRNALRFGDVMPIWLRILFIALPSGFWKWILGLVRRIKHRRLLERVE